jgi:hypothetical protein
MVRSGNEASGLGSEAGMTERQGTRGDELVGALLMTLVMS